MVNVKKRTKFVIVFCLVLVLCLGSAYTTEASKKIKSKSVSLSANNITIGVGEVITLIAIMKPVNSTDSLKWSTSNKDIATVNKYGAVTAKKEGTVTITVRTSSKKKATCKVTIKKYLTQEEIVSLISADCLGEETIIELIKNNSIAEDRVKELIKSNSITKETVKKLIVENTLSEEDVKRIVQKNVETSSGTNSDWESGQELKLYDKQSFPMTFENAGITITDISIKKEHVDKFVDGEYAKYKYSFIICYLQDGSLQADKDIELNISYSDINGSPSHYCNSWIINKTSNRGEFFEEDDKMYYKTEDYTSCDWNEFYVDSMTVSCSD
ncbi:MAG: Ig-like domain-containing protein [Lachnospiraceae bacterium]|nr:Ig-like domain-containing protein [Lachnospiraceae bacterium]